MLSKIGPRRPSSRRSRTVRHKTYYAAKTRSASARAVRDSALTEPIEQVHEDIHELTPNVKILLMGYLQLLETNGALYCIPLIDDDETQWLADTGKCRTSR